MKKDSGVNGDDAVVSHFDRLSSTGFWSRLYSEWEGDTYHFQIRRQRVLELLPERLGDVLDIGCGPGVMAEAVTERGGTLLGIDISPEMVKEATDKFSHLSDVRFEIGNTENLESPDESFDQVIAMAVVEYLSTPDIMMKEINRVLKPGGLALITVPKRSHIDRLTVKLTTPIRKVAATFVEAQSDNLPRLCLQPDELDNVAAKFGMEFVAGRQYQFTPFPYPFTRLAPNFFMRLNVPFDDWTETRNAIKSYFAHGYIGLYRKV